MGKPPLRTPPPPPPLRSNPDRVHSILLDLCSVYDGKALYGAKSRMLYRKACVVMRQVDRAQNSS